MTAAAITTTTSENNESTVTAPAAKKQKTTTAVKSVKAVDPAIIQQRREVVHKRVLRLESKLAKDRALLAKYTVPAVYESQQQQDDADSGSANEK